MIQMENKELIFSEITKKSGERLHLVVSPNNCWFGINLLDDANKNKTPIKYIKLDSEFNINDLEVVINELLLNYEVKDLNFQDKKIELYFLNKLTNSSLLVTIKNSYLEKDSNLDIKEYTLFLIEKFEQELFKTKQVKELEKEYYFNLFRDNLFKMSKEELIDLVSSLSKELLIKALMSIDYPDNFVNREQIDLKRLLKIQ